jgi:uncharacterized damage-inducible protein DinB
MRHVLSTALLLVSLSPPALADEPKPAHDPLSQDLRTMYERVKKFVIGSAAAMPEKEFDFRPTKEVRTFGQILGHIAEAQYRICSAAKGEKAPPKEVEKTVTGKAALQKALEESFAYCDSVYAQSTDASLASPVEFFGGKKTRLFPLAFNISHDNEHYGNLVTYLRLKNITPPSTAERR